MSDIDQGRFVMFGFGYLEIGLVVLLLALLFGAERTGKILRQVFGTYRQVDETRQQLKSSFNLTSLFRRGDKK
jgi:Sec-independent protein translocase protein TatA